MTVIDSRDACSKNTTDQHRAVEVKEGENDLRSRIGPCIFICFCGLLARIPFYFAYKPVVSGDSPGYTIPYFFWINHHFYVGERTPVYPLFLGLAQWLARTPARPELTLSAAYTTVCLQSFLDVVACCFLFSALRDLRVRRSIALIAALFAVTIAGLCFFEMNILNLSLSFFWLTLGATVFTVMMKRIGQRRSFIGASLLAGLVLSCAGLLRSENLVFLAVLTISMMAVSLRLTLSGIASEGRNKLALAAILMLALATPPVLGWMTWNYVGIGQFRLTTLTGWNRSKTVYNMFDQVDAEDKLLGEILSFSYRKRNRDGIIVRDHIWQVQTILGQRQGEMPVQDPAQMPLSAFHQKVDRFFEDVLDMQARGPCERPSEFCTALLTFQVPIYDYRLKVAMGDYVGRVSWKLIRKHPGMYLHNVVQNFVGDTFNFRYCDTTPAVEGYQVFSADGDNPVKKDALAQLLNKAIIAQAPILTGVYLITLGFVLFSPLILTGTFNENSFADVTVTFLAFATVGSFVATCMLAGYNKEYSIPHLGILVICAAYAIEHRARIVAALGLNRPVSATAGLSHVSESETV